MTQNLFLPGNGSILRSLTTREWYQEARSLIRLMKWADENGSINYCHKAHTWAYNDPNMGWLLFPSNDSQPEQGDGWQVGSISECLTDDGQPNTELCASFGVLARLYNTP